MTKVGRHFRITAKSNALVCIDDKIWRTNDARGVVPDRSWAKVEGRKAKCRTNASQWPILARAVVTALGNRDRLSAPSFEAQIQDSCLKTDEIQ